MAENTEYLVSARKYRPDSFESLIGQDNIVQTLKNSIIRGHLAHAYLFCGPRGVGKTSLARIFAKTINCEHPTENMDPCGECESCVSFKEGRSYCIHELDAASNNSVEDIKALIEQVNIPPQIGRYSVFIVDEVHMLSSAAFNAFLKTLEEPPAHAIFILATTEKHKILPTILSRCQTYDFNRISIPDMVKNLRNIATKENVKIDDESLHIIAMKADGAMRDALTIFDQTVAFCGTDVKYEDVLKNLNVLDYEYSFSLVDEFLAGDYASALLKFDEILSKGFNSLHFISALSSHLRDLIVAKSDGLGALLELPESLKARYREQAARCPLQFLYDALGITTACESGYKASVNPRLHIEFALMRLAWLMKAPAAPAVSAPAARVAAPARPAAPVAAPVAASAAPAVQPKAEAPKPAAPAEKPAPIAPVEKPAAPAEKPAAQAPAEKPAPAAPAQTPAAPAAAQPAPVAPADPAPTPRRSASKKPTSLSMASLASEKTAVSSDVTASKSPIPTDEEATAAFKKLPAEFADRPRLAQTLSSSKFVLGEENGMKVVKFSVVNSAQKEWIERNLLTRLEAKLRDLAGSPKVKLLVGVQESEAIESKPYMPEEQARELMSQYGELKNLVSDLDLDTK